MDNHLAIWLLRYNDQVTSMGLTLAEVLLGHKTMLPRQKNLIFDVLIIPCDE